jgi:uncharacterized protein YigA (DUF484 family)
MSTLELARRCMILLAVALLVAAGVLIFRGRAQGGARCTIALVCREKTSIAEEVIISAVQQIVDDHNAAAPATPITLEIRYSDSGRRLEQIYRDLGSRQDVLAVLDNSWGRELGATQVRLAVLELERPVVFLNADRLPGEHVNSWLFLGASDYIPRQLTAIYEHARACLTSSNGTPATNDLSTAVLLEFDENDVPYAAGLSVRKAIEEISQGPGRSAPYVVNLPCGEGWTLRDRNALTKARTRLLESIPRHADESPKLIVAHCHSHWGTEMIRWIDSVFRNTTIVTYHSALTRDRAIRLRKGTGNRLVMLTQDASATPAWLHRLRDILRAERPEIFTQDSADLFYMRRAAAGLELILAAVRDHTAPPSGSASEDLLALRDAVDRRLRHLRSTSTQTMLGVLSFDENGVELGNIQVVAREEDRVDSYAIQLNQKDEPIPNVQLLVSDLKLIDVSIRDDSAEVEFTLTAQCDPRILPRLAEYQPPKVLNPLRVTDGDGTAPLERFHEALNRLLQFEKLDHADYVRTRTGSFLSESRAELQYKLRGTFRLNALRPWWYPFDSHRISVPVHSTWSRERLRLSIDSRQNDASDASFRAGSPGWTPMHLAVTLLSSSDLSSFAAERADATPDTQRGSLLIELDVRRKPWSSIVLVYLPLLLIVLSSTAVLYLRFGEGDEAEVISTQSELSLGCVLAAVTYLISYAGLVPRMEKPLYSELLLGGTLLLTSVNFMFVVSIARREANPFLKFWSLPRYRYTSAFVAVLLFGAWPALGMFGFGFES